MYNLNGYEVFHSIPDSALLPDIEYVYVTDNSDIKSDQWKVIVDDSFKNMGRFEACYRIRFDPFKYVSNDICVYLDGDIVILKSIEPMVNRFVKSGMDMAIMIHPERTTMWDEYEEWTKSRHYPVEQMSMCLNYMAENGYDIFNYKGMYQGMMRIVRNTEQCRKVDKLTYELIKKFGTEDDVDRIDQTLWSYVINHVYTDVTLYPFSQSWVQSNVLRHCAHHSESSNAYNQKNFTNTGWVRNVLVPVDMESRGI